MTFTDLGLHAALSERCKQMGYENPTPIQQQAIPAVLDGNDVLACAETGTGKTAAFLLPILHKLQKARNFRGTQVLILSPTRELANQTEAVCKTFLPKGFTCKAIIGGSGYKHQMEALRKGVNIIIATPGRLIDYMDQGILDLSQVNTLVLDEADRMLDMGFLPPIKRIVKAIPAKRQTLFFSATMSKEIESIAYSMLNDPEIIEISKRGKAAATIKQTAYPVAQQFKMPLLLNLLETEDYDRVLVFTRTKRGADRLAHILEKRDHKSNRIHGDRSQSQRETALRAFKSGKTNILVATDVAARGIDIDSVSHVINYDIPEAPEDYVHRIGRTGRAGNTGNSITLFTIAEEHSMKAIEKLTGEKLERIHLPDFGGHVMPEKKPTRSMPRGRRSFGRSGRRR